MELSIEDSAAAASTPVMPRAKRIAPAARWCALAVAAIALIALLGWATNIQALKSVVPGLVTMKVNTAVGLLLLAAALAGTQRVDRARSIAVFATASICCAISIATAFEYLFRVNLHIDNLLVQDRDVILFPGRMAPITLFCFIVYAIAIMMLQLRRGIFAAQLAMGVIIGIAMVTLGGYLYGAPQMLAHAPYPVVAVHTALGMVLLSIGGLCVLPTDGPMSIMTADTTGGWMARRLIPTTLGVPLLVGLCVVIGQRSGLYGTAFAAAMIVSADIAVMTAVVWSVASLLSRADSLRQISERVAEQHSRLKDDFLATLSHELRTPLMAILGWAVMLSKRNDLDADAQEGLKVIERNARAQTQIIEDLLDMSRIVSGKMRLKMQSVDLRDVVSDAIQTVRSSADARGVHLDLSVGPQLPAIKGDYDRLQQIAWNLISNAVKFTRNGGRVRAKLLRCESRVNFVVEDDGQGIKPEFLPHLFERFRQADSGTTRRHGGLGLGLSIVRQLVELHGGTVSAQSPGEGQGTTFTVTFPIPAVQHDALADQPNINSQPASGSAVTPGDAQSYAVRGLRVLVVDDEADARSLIRRVLEECDAIVMTAASATDAIALLDAQKFDVLVCDIGMPNQDGYDLIRTIRSRDVRSGGDLPAAALTAFARAEDRTRALTSGFQLHTAKPIEPSELIAAVASLAGRARLN